MPANSAFPEAEARTAQMIQIAHSKNLLAQVQGSVYQMTAELFFAVTVLNARASPCSAMPVSSAFPEAEEAIAQAMTNVRFYQLSVMNKNSAFREAAARLVRTTQVFGNLFVKTNLLNAILTDNACQMILAEIRAIQI